MLASCHIMAQTTDWVVYLVCRSFSPTQRNYAWALALLSSHRMGARDRCTHGLIYQNHLSYRWLGGSGDGVFVAWRSSPWCGQCRSDSCNVSGPPNGSLGRHQFKKSKVEATLSGFSPSVAEHNINCRQV